MTNLSRKSQKAGFYDWLSPQMEELEQEPSWEQSGPTQVDRAKYGERFLRDQILMKLP